MNFQYRDELSKALFKHKSHLRPREREFIWLDVGLWVLELTHVEGRFTGKLTNYSTFSYLLLFQPVVFIDFDLLQKYKNLIK